MTSIRSIRYLLPLFLVVIFLAAPKSAGLQSCCSYPTMETSEDAGVAFFDYTVSAFNQAISDSSGTNFDGQTVKEVAGNSPEDNCTWSGSGLTPGLGGSSHQWTVNGGDVAGQHNHWGYDYVGWPSVGVKRIRENGPSHGVTFPCVTNIYQNMRIACPDGTHLVEYETNNLLETIIGDGTTSDQSYVINRRRGTPSYIDY